MDSELQQSIKRAKQLLYSSRHATMATVNKDGSPHNTPFFLLYNPQLTKIYWGSHPDSLHSQNILRTKQIFIVVYDAHEKGGLYIQANNAHPVSDKELDEALEIHNVFRAKEGKTPLEKSYYEGESPQLMWSADITNFWVLLGERYPNGHLIREYRHKITAKDLLS